MRSNRPRIILSISALFIGFAQLLTAQSGKIVVVEPSHLPESVQVSGQSIQLHSTSDGFFYLYVEQQQLQRIVVLDVTQPAHIKLVSTIRITAAAPFDFVRPIGAEAILVCFRDDSGSAILDLRQPKNPRLAPVNMLRQSGIVEPLGENAFLIRNQARANSVPTPRDYQVLDIVSPLAPKVLATVPTVEQTIVNSNTGTTFLLGANGLTIIRPPDVEEEFEASLRRN